MLSPALAAIARFDWCHPAITARADVTLLADVFWWERRDDICARMDAAQVQAAEQAPAAELRFCLAYVAMSVGDLSQHDLHVARLPDDPTGQLLRAWLRIEIQGRRRQYAAQACAVEHYLVESGGLPDWLATGCFASLNHPGIDPKPLLTVLTKKQLVTPLAALLIARLLAASGRVSEAQRLLVSSRSRWPECAALPWFSAKLAAQLGQRDEALADIDAAERLGLTEIEVLRYWLGSAVSDTTTDVAQLHRRVAHYLSTSPRQGAELATYLIIRYWMEGNLAAAHRLLTVHSAFQNMEERKADRGAQIFMRYAVFLCVAWQHNRHLYTNEPLPPLYAIGESHSLAFCNLDCQWQGMKRKGKSKFIMGAKMWHFASPALNAYKLAMKRHLQEIPDDAPLIFTIGEIDCRPNEGIWKTHRKTGRPLNMLIRKTVNGYIDYLQTAIADKPVANITICGIPAPAYTLEGKRDPGDKSRFLAMISEVNAQLANRSHQNGWNFLDSYTATLGEDGMSNRRHHLDGFHLQPAFYADCAQWLRCTSR